MDLGAAVLSFNHPDLTARCVQSVLDHFPSDQVHLVHNGSRQDVVHRLRELFPQVNHHVYADNLGYTGGVNRSLRHVFSKAQWALLITNDCELIQVGEVPNRPAFVAPLIWLRKTNRVNSLGGAADWSNGRLRHCADATDWAKASERYIPGTAFLLHQEVFTSVGDFDETLHTYWEDVDFSRRCEAKGWPLEVTNQFHFRHGVGKTCHKDPFYTHYLYQRNRRRVSRRYVKGLVARVNLETRFIWEMSRSHWRDFNKAAMKALNHLRPLFVRN